MNRYNRYTYKAKRKDNGEWVYGFPIIYASGNIKITIPQCRKDLQETSKLVYGTYEIIPETLCQCTGLQDKNGLKIYEGDILQNKRTQDGKPYGSLYKTVVWNDAGFNIRERAKQLEVIGNKFDKEVDEND